MEMVTKFFPDAVFEIAVVEIDRFGQPILFDALNSNGEHNTQLLQQAIEAMPLFVNYIGCGNCGMPICTFDDVINVIPAVRLSNIPVGFVLPAFSHSMVRQNTNLMRWTSTVWKRQVKCINCNTTLTVQALTVINRNIENVS